MKFIGFVENDFTPFQNVVVLVGSDQHFPAVYIDHLPEVVDFSGEMEILVKFKVVHGDDPADIYDIGQLVFYVGGAIALRFHNYTPLLDLVYKSVLLE